PFVLERFSKDEVAVMARNPDWYGKAPRMEALGFQIYSSQDGLINALKANEIDLINVPPPGTLQALEGTPDVITDSIDGIRSSNLVVNLDSSKPALQDVKVREALDLAIDRQKLVDVVYQGEASAANTVIPPATGWANPDITPQVDVDRANQLLDEAGYEKGS